MSARPRIDLDGVHLVAEDNPDMVIAILRYRTTTGLALLMPESADFVVDWEHIEEAQLDLASGSVRVVFTPGFVAAHNWLRGSRVLVGQWVDRFTMT
jgi:hypothetical protein